MESTNLIVSVVIGCFAEIHFRRSMDNFFSLTSLKVFLPVPLDCGDAFTFDVLPFFLNLTDCPGAMTRGIDSRRYFPPCSLTTFCGHRPTEFLQHHSLLAAIYCLQQGLNFTRGPVGGSWFTTVEK